MKKPEKNVLKTELTLVDTLHTVHETQYSFVTSMLMLSSKRTFISLISTRIVPATYAAHLQKMDSINIYIYIYIKYLRKDEPTSEMDPWRSNGRLSHRILVSHLLP